jgi:hypothetical protein
MGGHGWPGAHTVRAAAGMRLRQGYGALGGLPALPIAPPSLTQHKRFFHSLDKHSSDLGAFLKKADLETSRKEKQHKLLTLCSLYSFAAKLLLNLHDSSLLAERRSPIPIIIKQIMR